jgi:hypothetical protein
MSVEVRLLLPRRIFELLQREAEKKQLTLQDLILLALEKLLREGI